MIKQIQLRGISRSPSDRMTEDGGLEESLNIYLDTAESAPALVPEDVTNSLGLTDDLQAEKVFVHKAANYENIITVQRDGDDRIPYLFGWVDGIQQPIYSLDDKEEIQSVTSIGNTVIVNTSMRPLYILFKDGKYSAIGDAIPMPTIEFFDKETPIKNFPEGSGISLSYPASLLNNSHIEVVGYQAYLAEGEQSINDSAVIDFAPSFWTRLNEDGSHEVEGARKVVTDMKAIYDGLKKNNSEKGILNNPVWVTFGVRLYDGSLKMSMPYMVSGGIETPVDIFALRGNLASASYYFLRMNHYYQLGVRLHDYAEWQIKPWSDIIKGIDVYMSDDINALDWKSMSVEERTDNGKEVYAKFKVSGLKGDYFDYAASCTTFSKVAEFAIDETFYKSGTPSVNDIRQDYIIDMKGKILNEDRMGSLLSDEDYTFIWSAYKGKSITFNNRVLNFDLSELLPSGPTWLLSQRFNSVLPIPRMNVNVDGSAMAYPAWWNNSTFEDTSEMQNSNYFLTYYLKSELGEEAVVYGISDEDQRFAMNYSRNQLGDIKPIAFPLFMFPDTRCKRIDITGNGKTVTMDMKPHPYLPNSSFAYVNDYLYWMIIEGAQEKETPAEQKILGLHNKIALSKMDNPLFFDTASFYTFQSKVLGVALATTTLSQGQFGQFPLYVFTEDGVWAMETAADGSFVTSKPLSRDVCTNPDSITSIDNAVVFVTDKGVMLLQGSQVVNISPYMNGRHHTINDSAQEMLALSDYASLLLSLTDEDVFMAFVKAASIAYDYPGKRLVFIKEDEEYQYVYKLDTQTWHKLKHEQKLMVPINSYPECFVQGAMVKHVVKWYVTEYGSQEEFDYLADRIRVVLPHLRDEDIDLFLQGDSYIDLTDVQDDDVEWLVEEMNAYHVATEISEQEIKSTHIYDLSTVLDGTREQSTELGCIVTRPLDLGYADVKKVIKDVRIRGEYAKGHVQYILQGSDDGVNYFNTKLKQKSWKLFRIIIVCALDRHERISWVDVDFDIRYNNKLR